MRSKNKIEIKEFSYFSHDTDRLRLVGKKFPKILIANPEDGRKSPRAVSGICLSRPPLRIELKFLHKIPIGLGMILSEKLIRIRLKTGLNDLNICIYYILN